MSWHNVTLTKTQPGPKRKKPWLVRWYGGIDPDTGRPKRHSKSFRLRSEAERFRVDKQQEIRRTGRPDRPSGQSLSKLCDDFVRTKKASLRPASLKLYMNTINRLVTFFGRDKEIGDIDAKDADLFMAGQTHRLGSNTKLSPWTRAQIITNCRAIFAAAVRWDQITRNPFLACEKPKKVLSRWHCLQADEYLRLLDVAPDGRWRCFYSLAFTTGCRFGELFSFVWSDVDFLRAMVRISNRAGTPTMPAFHVKDGEQREIPLPEHTLRILLEYQAQAPEGLPYILLTDERYERVLLRWRKLGMVDDLWENRYMINNVLRSVKVHARWAKIQLDGKLTVHGLRKSYAQTMALRGVPIRVLQQVMGHSDSKTTLTYYTQMDPSSAAIARTATEQMLESAERDQTDARLTRDPVPLSTDRKTGNEVPNASPCQKTAYEAE